LGRSEQQAPHIEKLNGGRFCAKSGMISSADEPTTVDNIKTTERIGIK
jgi:hypothetical protein